MGFTKFIGAQVFLLVFIGSCTAQRKDNYFGKVVQNKDFIKNLSLEVQNKLSNDTSKNIVLEPSDSISRDKEIIKSLKELDIFAIYLFRSNKTNKDSIIVYSSHYNPFLGKRKSITYCYSNCKMSTDYKKITDSLYYRKHKNHFC